jgi:hypothetical protein
MNKEPELSTFFLAFMAQEVIITTTVSTTVNFTDQDGNTAETIPVFYEGILLDEDDKFYYLGKNPNEIDQAVPKAMVLHIMTKPISDLYEEILDSMGNPTKQEDVN